MALTDRLRPSTVAALVGALLLTACGGTPDEQLPFRVPDTVPEVFHYSGSPIAGVVPREIKGHSSVFYQVIVEFWAVEKMPVGFGAPVATIARLVISAVGRTPAILPSANRSVGVSVAIGVEERDRLIGELEDGRWGDHARYASLRGAVAPGITSRFALSGEDGSLNIEVHRDADDTGPVPEELQVVLVTGALEACLLEPSPEEGVVAVTVAFSSPYAADSGEAVVVTITASPPPAPGTPEREAHNQAVATCKEQLPITSTRIRDVEPVKVQIWQSIQPAIHGLAGAENRRSALVYLAQKTEAWLAEDVGLSGTDELIGELVNALDSETTPEDAASLGFELEGGAYRVLIEDLTDDEPSNLARGLLLQQAGEPGAHPELLVEILERARDLAHLRRLILNENILFLMDSAPGARVRAYDWLVIQEKAPEGYSPLASAEERRKALARYEEEVPGNGTGE